MSLPEVAMTFNVDGWDVGYGTPMDMESLIPSVAEVILDVELSEDQWVALDPDPSLLPPAGILFVDGVRRIDARVWIDDLAGPEALSPTTASGYLRVLRSRCRLLL